MCCITFIYKINYTHYYRLHRLYLEAECIIITINYIIDYGQKRMFGREKRLDVRKSLRNIIR
jgi:hypothetical protein